MVDFDEKVVDKVKGYLVRYREHLGDLYLQETVNPQYPPEFKVWLDEHIDELDEFLKKFGVDTDGNV